MKNFIKYTLLLFAFWLLVFALQRAVFLIYNIAELEGISTGDILMSWWYALPMDLATTAFLSCIPLIFMCIALFARKKIWPISANVLTVLLLLIVLLTGIIDTSLYSNWGSKVNARAVSYALFPGETMNATKAVPIWLFVMIYFIEAIALIFIYLRFLRAKVPAKAKLWAAIPLSIVVLALMPLLFRGGFQKYPIGKNSVYYSMHRVLNYAALNSPWNLINVLSKMKQESNPYIYFDDAKAVSIVKAMEGNSCDSLPQLVNCQRPNIVLILMESISAENMRKLGGKEDIMPGLDSLAGEGMLFTRYYASGFRTEQGLVALISGFPAQPEATIMREFGKFERLANLGRDMKQAGYQCNYYFSGDLAFANTGAYLRSSGFTKLLDRDGRQWQRTTEWGSLDEELFSCHLQEAARDSMPFFSVIMTSTNHEPFDAPVSNHFKGGGEAQSYKNTSHYTDSCVYAYIQAAKRSDWWGNTLFIVTSDHAHYLPMNRAKNEPERHHVPFLLLGGALKPEFKGTSCATTSSQTDLPALLLSQLQLSAQAFNYSSNVLDPCKRHFAFYTFDNGFGMINDSSWLVYDHDLSKVVLESPGISLKAREDLLNFGKAYLQCMYKDYLER